MADVGVGVGARDAQSNLVRWRATVGSASPGQREVLSAPRKLQRFSVS